MATVTSASSRGKVARSIVIGLRNLLGTDSSSRHSDVRGGIWTLADQGLISLTNFVTMILLARNLGAHHFGAFVLIYTGLLFANTLQAALFTRAHNVQASALEGEEYRDYTATSIAAQTVFAALLTLACLNAAAVALALGFEVTGLLIGLAFALFTWQMQEFVRQVHYTNRRADLAFGLDLISYGGQGFLIAALWALGLLTGPNALYAIGGTSALSAMLGFWRMRHLIGRPSAKLLEQNWRFGRWLVGESLGLWLSNQMYPLLAAAIVGVSAAGVLKAVQNLVAPSHIVMNAFMAFSIPRAARHYREGGKGAMLTFLVPISVAAVAVLSIFWLAIGLFSDQMLRFLYSNAYSGQSTLLWLMIFSYFTLFVSQAQGVALLAVENTRSLFLGRLASIAVTFTVGVWLIASYGVEGAALGGGLSSIALSVYLVFVIMKQEDASLQPVHEESPARLASVGGEL